MAIEERVNTALGVNRNFNLMSKSVHNEIRNVSVRQRIDCVEQTLSKENRRQIGSCRAWKRSELALGVDKSRVTRFPEMKITSKFGCPCTYVIHIVVLKPTLQCGACVGGCCFWFLLCACRKW